VTEKTKILAYTVFHSRDLLIFPCGSSFLGGQAMNTTERGRNWRNQCWSKN